MIEKPYFVILNHPDGCVYPLMENAYEMAMFKTEGEAIFKAGANGLGETFGYEVFELGGGL